MICAVVAGAVEDLVGALLPDVGLGVVVQHQVNVKVGRHLVVDEDEELLELGGTVAAAQGEPITLPVAMSKAANKLVVPWLT